MPKPKPRKFQLTLSDADHGRLAALAHATGSTIAYHIRQAIRAYPPGPQAQESQEPGQADTGPPDTPAGRE